jgi:hypothetical protein
MTKWILAFIFMVLVLGLALDVFACNIVTIVKSDGTIVNCTVCGNVINCL